MDEAGAMDEADAMDGTAGKTAGMEETASAKTMEVEIVEFKSGAIGNIISTILKTKSIFSLNLQGDVNYYEILTSFVNLLEIILLKLIEDNFIDPIIPTKKTKNA